MNIIRSPFFYVGDKYKLMEQIRKEFPTNINRFIEPFTGGGSSFLNTQANEYILNDIDTSMFNLHKFLIRNSKNTEKFFKKIVKMIKKYNLSHSFIEDIVPLELKNKYKKTYYSKFNKNAYENLRRDYNNRKKEDYYKLFLLKIYGFNRMIRFNSLGEFNIPPGNVDFNKNVEKALYNYFDFVKEKKIKIYNLDYRNFLKKIKLKKDDFLYFDPPYLISKSEYNKLWSELEERKFLEFLDLLNEKKVKFAVSNVTHFKGNTNDLFINWSKKYNSIKINSNYISCHDNTQKDIREVLITNYDKKG